MVSFSEVIATAEGSTVSVGDLFGHGMALFSHRPFRRMMPEHGYILSLMVVRPKTQYMNGIPRHFSRLNPGDFWNPENEIMGPQEVYNRELHGGHTSREGVFGYTGRHEEYRTNFGRVSGDIEDNASPWHFSRNLSTSVALNADFIQCQPSNRPFVDETTFTATAFNKMKARRPVSQRPVI